MTAATLRRTSVLAGSNARLMMRNKLTLTYATILPLLPVLPLVLGETSGEAGQASAATWIGSALLTAWLFPVYYNLLSMVVTRRDELVLKRLRTGEATDRELVWGMAAPGVAIALGVSVVIVVAALVKGVAFPVNPLLLVVAVVGGCVLMVALALWTAAWTKTAEAAQLTSMPVILLAVVGTLGAVIPDRMRDFAVVNPVAALDQLVRLSWWGEQDYDPTASLTFAETWPAGALPVAVLVAWSVFGIWLAQRTMRWEPRV